MHPHRKERLAVVMAALPHDPAYIVTVMVEFADELARHARWQAGRLGVRATAEEIETLVHLYAVCLQECAAGWRPDGGALPWTWARHRLTAVTVELLRPDTTWDARLPEGFDPEYVAPPLPDIDPGPVDWREVLERRAALDDGLARLVAALESKSDRDVNVFFEFVDRRRSVEEAAGRSVAEMFDISADLVRQIVRRIRLAIEQAGLRDDFPDLFDRDGRRGAGEGPRRFEQLELEAVGAPTRAAARRRWAVAP